MNHQLHAVAEDLMYIVQYDAVDSRIANGIANLCAALEVPSCMRLVPPEHHTTYLIAALAKRLATLEE